MAVPPTYQPTSRRPIAGLFRATAHLAVRACVRLGIHPDVISWSSVVVAGGAAVCFWQAGHFPILLLAGSGLCLIRLWLNMLDGMVALAAGKASLRGEIFNDFPDRISDAVIFAGVAHSGLCAMPLGYWAAIMALLTAYIGITGQAVGGKREYGGIMSKPWRMALLCAGAMATYGLLLAGIPVRLGPLTVLEWTCILVIAGSVQTVLVRLRRILKGIAEREKTAVAPAGGTAADLAGPSRVARQRPMQDTVNDSALTRTQGL